MRQYELAIRIAQVHHLVDERKYKKALAVIQTLDMRQVRALSDLKVFAEVYTKTEQFDAAKATYLRIYRRSHTKRVLYRLIYLSIRTNALNDAEAYYQEFIRMNPNERDALILRYRIDKAAGAPVGRLIEILQQLKQVEYIEEWAYELAKLYHRAGRKEECREECEDIILWFGTGEIVERARILIEHLEEKDSAMYFDDKDFTVPKKEEPNPEDTGSLPDLDEYIEERKAQERKSRKKEEEKTRGEQQEEEFRKEEPEMVSHASSQSKEKEAPSEEEEFLDDYEDDDFEGDGIDISQKAKDGIQKLSGLLKLGKKEEEGKTASALEEKKGKKVTAESAGSESEVKMGFVPHSQSGMGITQDLAKEISAIYELEHREQLKEKAVTVIQDASNIATNVVERMTQAAQKNIGRSYIPLDIEEIQPVKRAAAGSPEETTAEPLEEATAGLPEEATAELPVETAAEPPEKTAAELPEEATAELPEEATAGLPEKTAAEVLEEITESEDEAVAPGEDWEEDTREIPSVGEAVDEFHEGEAAQEFQERETDEELSAELADETEEPENIPEMLSEEELRDRTLTLILEEEVAKIENDISEKDLIESTRQDTEMLKNLMEEKITDPEPEDYSSLEPVEIHSVEPMGHMGQETEESRGELPAEEVSVSQEELPEENDGEEPPEELPEKLPEENDEEEPPEENDEEELPEENGEEELPEENGEEKLQEENDEEELPEENGEEKLQEENDEEELPEENDEEELPEENGEEEPQEELQEENGEEEPQEELPEENGEEEPQETVPAEQASALEGYRAPEIPVVETSYMEMPEITYDELPTTRALQQSFKNVLKLIAGELDPSHFVLMGDGTERIVGVSKQIVRVMKETGYLSQGRIAKIHARQINKMDLISFRTQLKGNCLLIEGASDLLFPTITRLFSIMEEYWGDFVVILADDGTTLDQLFRFVPVLAKKFKYIIDISQYTREDYL